MPTTQKVVRIIGRLNVGGPSIHTILLTHLLDPDKFVTQLVTGSEGSTEGSMRYLADERGIEPYVIPEMGREISWRDDFIALWKLIWLLRREKPDIIHTHTAKAGTLGRIAAMIALPGRKKRIFHTFHGHVFHSYFSPKKTEFFRKIECWLAKHTDRLIAVSEQTRDDLVAYGIAPSEKIEVVKLGLDLDPFLECEHHRGELRRELSLTDNSLLVGIVARLVPVKDIPNFLHAAERVAKCHADTYFLVIGDGELREALEKQARESCISERILFLGYRRDLARIYADLDVVTLCSLNEGLPVSIIEGMSSGKCIVATTVGGVPDLIQEGETGYLVEPQQPEQLAVALCKALESAENRQQLGRNARQSARNRFHIRRLVADIERLYGQETLV